MISTSRYRAPEIPGLGRKTMRVPPSSTAATTRPTSSDAMSSWIGSDTIREQMSSVDWQIGGLYHLRVRHKVRMPVLWWVVVVASLNRVFAQAGEYGGPMVGGRGARAPEAECRGLGVGLEYRRPAPVSLMRIVLENLSAACEAAIKPDELAQADGGVDLLQLPVHPELRRPPRLSEAEILEVVRLPREPWVAGSKCAALTHCERLGRMEGEDLTTAASADALAVGVRRAEASRRVEDDRLAPTPRRDLPTQRSGGCRHRARWREGCRQHGHGSVRGRHGRRARSVATCRRRCPMNQVRYPVRTSSLRHGDEGERRHE